LFWRNRPDPASGESLDSILLRLGKSENHDFRLDLLATFVDIMGAA
jgi:hypothetical protein